MNPRSFLVLVEVVPSDHPPLHRPDLRAQPQVHHKLAYLSPFRHRINFYFLENLLRFILPE